MNHDKIEIEMPGTVQEEFSPRPTVAVAGTGARFGPAILFGLLLIGGAHLARGDRASDPAPSIPAKAKLDSTIGDSIHSECTRYQEPLELSNDEAIERAAIEVGSFIPTPESVSEPIEKETRSAPIEPPEPAPVAAPSSPPPPAVLRDRDPQPENPCRDAILKGMSPIAPGSSRPTLAAQEAGRNEEGNFPEADEPSVAYSLPQGAAAKRTIFPAGEIAQAVTLPSANFDLEGGPNLAGLTERVRRGGRLTGISRVAPDAGGIVVEFGASTLPDGRIRKITALALNIANAETIVASGVECRFRRLHFPNPASSFVYALFDAPADPRKDFRHPARGEGRGRAFGRLRPGVLRGHRRCHRGGRNRLGRRRARGAKHGPASGTAHSCDIQVSCHLGEPSRSSNSGVADASPIRERAMTTTTGKEAGSEAAGNSNLRPARMRSAGDSKPKRTSPSPSKSVAQKSVRPRRTATSGEGVKSRASRSSFPKATDSKAKQSKLSAPNAGEADANPSRSSSSNGGAMTKRNRPAASNEGRTKSTRSTPSASNGEEAKAMRPMSADTNEGDADAKRSRLSSSNGGLMTERNLAAATSVGNAKSKRSKQSAPNGGDATAMRSMPAVAKEEDANSKRPWSPFSNGSGMTERNRSHASNRGDAQMELSRSTPHKERDTSLTRRSGLVERLIRLNEAPGPTDASFWTSFSAGGIGAASGDADGMHGAKTRTARTSVHARESSRFGPSRHGEGTSAPPDWEPGGMAGFGPASENIRNGGGIAAEETDRFDLRGDAGSVVEEIGSPTSLPRSTPPGIAPAYPGSAAKYASEETNVHGETCTNPGFHPPDANAGSESAGDVAPEDLSAARQVADEDQNPSSAARMHVGEFDARDEAESIHEEHVACPPSHLAGGKNPEMRSEAPVRAGSCGSEEASGYGDVDARFGHGTSVPAARSEADRGIRLEGTSETRSATDDLNGTEAVRKRHDECDDWENPETCHEEPDSRPSFPLPDGLESGMSATVPADAELRGMENASGHNGGTPHADAEARELARDANESVFARSANDAHRRPDRHSPFPDEYPARARTQDDRRERDEGEAVSGANAAVEDFDAIFDGNRRGRPTGDGADSDMRESANPPEIAEREALQGHAGPVRERACVASKRMPSGRGYPWAAQMTAAVLAGALGFAIAKFSIRGPVGPVGPLATHRVEEFAAYPDSPASPTVEETGILTIAKPQEQDSLIPDATLLSELPDFIESNAAGGEEGPSSSHGAEELSDLSESPGFHESPVQSKMANTSGLSDLSAMSGHAGQSDPSGSSGMHERSPGDVDMAGSGDQENAADPFGNESDPLAANAIPNRVERSDGPVSADPSSGTTSGNDSPGRHEEFDTDVSANGDPLGNIPGEAPQPDLAEPVAPAQGPGTDDLAGDMGRMHELQAEAMESTNLIADRVEANERSLLEFAPLLTEFSQLIVGLEETQVVLLDIADRVETIETAYSADLAEASGTLSEIENRVNSLTATMAIISRMTVNSAAAARNEGAPDDGATFRSESLGLPIPEGEAVYDGADERFDGGGDFDRAPPDGFVPADVAIGDFVEGYGYVIAIEPAADGNELVIMEHGSAPVSE